MQDLFELWVADAELLAPNRSHAIHGGIVEPVAKSVSADHSSRAHNDNFFGRPLDWSSTHPKTPGL
jgi:hypothetical protein